MASNGPKLDLIWAQVALNWTLIWTQMALMALEASMAVMALEASMDVMALEALMALAASRGPHGPICL